MGRDDAKDGRVLMRVNIAGYAGDPVTLFCAWDRSTDLLLVGRTVPYEGGARDGFLLITNQARDAAFDVVITEEELRDAIDAFFALDSLGLINFKEEVQRANPTSKLERDGVDASGTKYRLAPDITNAHVATLIASLYVGRQRDFRDVAEFAEEISLISI